MVITAVLQLEYKTVCFLQLVRLIHSAVNMSGEKYSKPGGGGTFLLYRYVWPQRVWFSNSFGLKKGKDFNHSGLKQGMIFTQAWRWVIFLLQGTIFSASTLAYL